jgi:DNA-binding response OmpR family regulator
MSARKTVILIIDDDQLLREELADQLEDQGDLVAIQAGALAEGRVLAAEGKASLIILDVELPDGDGRMFAATLRDDGVTAPIIMLTGRTADQDTIMALDNGANDYVEKPFKFNVLLARIRAHLRSHEASEDAVFKVGPYDFRPGTKLLQSAAGKRVRLTDKETAILKYLYRSGPKAVSRDELLKEVWGYNAAVTTHTLETHIYRLRQKIEADAQAPKLLLTETGGYRLQP